MPPEPFWDYLGSRRGTPWEPFPYQVPILEKILIPWGGLDSNEWPYPRFFTLRCGRRAGKTTLLEKLAWRGLLAPDDQFGPPFVGITADTEEHAMKVWRPFIWHLENTHLAGLLDTYSREYMRVTLKNGAVAQLFSANNPNALSGEGVSTWIVDEAQFFSQAAYDNMEPSTTDRDGVIIMAGVAQGEGPFKEASYKGREKEPLYWDFRYPTSANPMINRYTLEQIRKKTPPHLWSQLYEAEWVAALGKIFRNVPEIVHKDIRVYMDPAGWAFTERPRNGHVYYGGLDLARLQDWSVFTVWNARGKLVAWDRFNLVSWELQKQRIMRLSAAFGHPLTGVDSSGIGDPIFEDLTTLGLNGVPYQIVSNAAKRQLIDRLAVRISGAHLAIPPVGTLVRELERFEAKRASEHSQVIQYTAPAGSNDDFVLSTALAVHVLPPPLPPVLPGSQQPVLVQGGSYTYI